jgi:hypothetical protein
VITPGIPAPEVGRVVTALAVLVALVLLLIVVRLVL